MKVENFDENYQVIGFKMERKGRDIVLKWNYQRGTHFFVFLYDGRTEISLEEIVKEMTAHGLTGTSAIQRSGHLLYTTKNGKVRVFFLRQKEFYTRGDSYTISGSMMDSTIPYGIRVFIGEYEKEKGIMHLYQAGNPDISTEFVPVKVDPVIQYKSKVFSEEKICILRVPYLQDYEDGALEYHVDGTRFSYPLSAEGLGRDLIIKIPKNLSVHICVADEYKKYYRV